MKGGAFCCALLLHEKKKGTCLKTWNGKPHKGYMSISERLNTFRREDMGILPGLPSVGDGLTHLLDGRSYTVPAFPKKGTAKKGNPLKFP